MGSRARAASTVGTGLVTFALVVGCSGGPAGSAPVVPAAPMSSAASAPDATEQSAEALDLLTRSYQATVAEGSARFEMQMVITANGSTTSTHAAGDYDFVRQVGNVSMDGKAFGVPGTIETVRGSNGAYMRAPGQGFWFRLPPSASAQYDPMRQLEMLRTVSRDLRIVGTEDVNGELMRRISFGLDYGELAARGGASMGQAAADEFGTLPGDVWIDAKGRIRQIRISGGDATAGMELTVSYSDFGAPVRVQEPDPALVRDLPTR